MTDDRSRARAHLQALADWANRDPAARERLVPIVYEELRRLAHHYMRGERAGHTLQTTALVNEVYLRLAGLDALRWRDRAHFFAMAATLMRRVLVDYARQRGREKRGAGVSLTSPDENAAAPQPAVDIVALDEALERLATVDPQQAAWSSSGSLPGCRSRRPPRRSAFRRRP